MNKMTKGYQENETNNNLHWEERLRIPLVRSLTTVAIKAQKNVGRVGRYVQRVRIKGKKLWSASSSTIIEEAYLSAADGRSNITQTVMYMLTERKA